MTEVNTGIYELGNLIYGDYLLKETVASEYHIHKIIGAPFFFHRKYKRTEGLKFSGKAFIRKISECVGWNLDKKYVVIGEYDEENRSVDFDLTTESCDPQG